MRGQHREHDGDEKEDEKGVKQGQHRKPDGGHDLVHLVKVAPAE